MKEIELNDNDQKLLAFCYNRRRFISEIARHIGIDVKNVSVRVEKLIKADLIEVIGTSNKKYIRTKSGDKTKEYFLSILQTLKSRGGEVSQEDFHNILAMEIDGNFDQDKFNATLRLLYVEHPKLVQQMVKITPEGEMFLKNK